MATELAKRLKTRLTAVTVADAVSRYLEPGAYSGAQFDRLGAGESPDRFTEADFLAVMTLSVAVPPVTRRWLLGEGFGYVSDLLKNIPDGADALWDEQDHLRRGSAAWELWYLLMQGTGMGATTTSKLMAVKRPHLVPIHDSVVSRVLSLPSKDSWSTWRTYMRGEWMAIGPEVRKAADEAGGAHLSNLRVIDIVVWLTETSRLQGERKARRDAARKAKGKRPLVVVAPCPQRLRQDQRFVEREQQ